MLPTELETVLRLVGALLTVAAAILAWFYLRRLAVDAAEKRKAQHLMSALTALETEINSRVRMIDIAMNQLASCEDRAKACQEELRRTQHAVKTWEAFLLRAAWDNDVALETEE